MSDDKPKFGAGHAGAMGRQGLSELRNAFYPESNIARNQVEYGVWGTLTPGEVARSRDESVRDLSNDPGQGQSTLDDKLRELDSRDDPGNEPPGMDLEPS